MARKSSRLSRNTIVTNTTPRTRRSAAVAASPPSEDQMANNLDSDQPEQSPSQSEPKVEDDDDDDQRQDGNVEGEEDADEAAADSDQGDEASNPSTLQEPLPRPRRGRGRGRGRGVSRQSGRSSPEAGRDGGSDAGTPRRGRGRGRGPGRGGRGRGRGAKTGPAQVTRVPIDKEGTMMDVIDDEVQVSPDPEGETKVNKDGHLLGGREYRVRTFTIAGRENRLYMLSTEPARCTGYRDSYLFFNKHLTLFKIIIDDYEKHDLIDREIIPHSYKGRAIGVVTARSVYREFGCKIVVGGKKVTDDYFAQAARDRGDVEGELSDPYDKIPESGEHYNVNQYVAWHGASSVYHTQGPNVPIQGGRPLIGSKRKALTSANWMYEHALASSNFNSALTQLRKTSINGVYDPHTNLMCYPASMQPTHTRWEEVPSPPPSPAPKRRRLSHANGIPSTKPLLTNGITPHSTSHDDLTPYKLAGKPSSSTFPPPSRYLKQNYLITDFILSTPPSPHFTLDAVPSSIASPRPISAPDFSAGRPPELGIPQISEAEMEEVGLPEECRRVIRDARVMQAEWASQWRTQKENGAGTSRIV